MTKTHRVHLKGSIAPTGEVKARMRRPSPSATGGAIFGGFMGGALGGPAGALVGMILGGVAGEVIERSSSPRPATPERDATVGP